MRIISGEFRGRKLAAPQGDDVRPTVERVKESIFNIIQFDVPGARVLDLFAGTGQLGLEAISRGARETVFVDSARSSLELARSNAEFLGTEKLGAEFLGTEVLGTEKVGAGNRAVFVLYDAFDYLRRGERFDIILLDPPYGGNLLEKCLKSILEFDNLNKSGIIITESKVDQKIQPVGDIELKREYRYGQTKLTLFVKN